MFCFTEKKLFVKFLLHVLSDFFPSGNKKHIGLVELTLDFLTIHDKI